MDESRKMLEEELQAEIKQMSDLTPGSEERIAAVNELSKLYRLKIDEAKGLEEAMDRYFKVGIAAAELIIPLMFYGTWMRRGFKFEETGTFTSTTFKGLFNRFKPTKR